MKFSKSTESEEQAMKYVTFHYDLMRGNVSDLKVHEDKEKALKHFNSECHRWFELNTKFKADKLPASYGYPMRKYYGISARAFKKMFGYSVDEAMAIAQGQSEDRSEKTTNRKYAVYVKNGKYWRADRELHTLKSAKEIVKGLRTNGEKAFFSRVGKVNE